MSPRSVLFRFFTPLITSYCAGLATFRGKNEIEDEFYLVIALISPNKWRLMTASLDLGLYGRIGNLMDSLRISLFGRPQIIVNKDVTLSLPPTTQALAIYLILKRHHRHRREILAGQFWKKYDELRARNCLNTTLWRLRQALEPEDVPRGTYLLTTPTGDGEVGFNIASRYWLDVEEFEQRARLFITHPDTLSPEKVLELEKTLQLYVGDLLEGMYQDWVLRERERLRRIYLDSLICLMHYYHRTHMYDRCLIFGNQILALEPLREDVHRTVIEAYWVSGQRTLAVQQYTICCEILMKELGIDPMEETQALYYKIVATGGKETAVSHTSPNMPQAIQQLSVAMQELEKAQSRLYLAIKVMKQCIQSQHPQ